MKDVLFVAAGVGLGMHGLFDVEPLYSFCITIKTIVSADGCGFSCIYFYLCSSVVCFNNIISKLYFR